MKKFNKFLNKLKAFELTNLNEASKASTDLLSIDPKEAIRQICLIYDKYNYWLKLYINAKHTDFTSDIDWFKFKAYIGWSFDCSKYADIEITKEIFEEIESTVLTNRDNILLKFKDFETWNPTPKNKLSPEWLQIQPTIYLMFTGNNPSLPDNTKDTDSQFTTEYTPEVLERIFDNLVKKKVTKKADKEHFLSIFTNNITGKVYWNSNIHGAKSALFDLMERLTGKQMKTTDLLQLFDTEVDDNNRNRTKNDNETISSQTKLVDAIFPESIIKP